MRSTAFSTWFCNITLDASILYYGIEESSGDGSKEEEKRQIVEIMYEIGVFSGDVEVDMKEDCN